MCAEHHKVLAAAATVFFAPPAQLENIAEQALANRLLSMGQCRAVARLMSNRQFQVPFFKGGDHCVRLLETLAHGLFEKYVTAEFRTCQHHIVMTVQPARGNTYDLRTLCLKHPAIIGIALRCFEPFRCCGAPLRNRIGNGHYLSLLYLVPDHIKPVAVVSAPRPANNSNFVLSSFGLCTTTSPRGQTGQSERRARDEIPPSHNFTPVFTSMNFRLFYIVQPSR